MQYGPPYAAQSVGPTNELPSTSALPPVSETTAQFCGCDPSPKVTLRIRTTIDRQDVTASTVECPDLILTVTSGVLKIVTHETLTPSGAFHLSVEANAQGVSAIAPSGAAYQALGGFRVETNLTPGATTQTEVAVLNVVGQGSAPNFTVRGVVHLTVNANGNVTALVNHFTSTGDCTP
jgi:hypothetical protein